MSEHDAGVEDVRREQLADSLFERALSRLPRSAAAIIGRDFRIIKGFREIFEDRGYDSASMLGRTIAEFAKRLETAFFNAPNGMALVELDGKFMRVNPAMCDLTGYPEEELTGLRVADIVHPEDMEEQVSLVRRAIAGEFDSFSLEKALRKKVGEPVWLVLSVSLVRSRSGEPLYVIAQTTDISDRK
jgi:PAS domain S-box-containing protein